MEINFYQYLQRSMLFDFNAMDGLKLPD